MPSAYKETTYHEVTRWTEETEIKYAPTGKRPGTKSADRYAGYAVAKTVGEALRLGSKPEDLLNDFEKGLLTMTGGPKRESPLDLMAIEDASDLTEVDLLLARWGYHEGPRANAEDDGEGDAEDDVRRNRTGYKGLRCEQLNGRVAQQYAKLRKAVVAKKHGIRKEGTPLSAMIDELAHVVPESTVESGAQDRAEAGISFPNEESQKFVTNVLPAPKQLQRSNAQRDKWKPRMLAQRRGDRSGSPSVKPEASTPVKRIRRKIPSAQPKSSVKQAEQEKRRSREATARVELEPPTKRAKVTPRSSSTVKQETTEGDETPQMTDCIPLQVGMVCTLTGFRPTEGFNGKEVVCKRYDPKSDRWIVSADWLNGAIKRVISENLVPTDDPVAHQPQGELHVVQEQTASQIREGDEVVVVADFDALGHDSVRLKLGDKGTVDEIDMDGDACISFERFDDMQWVGSADFGRLKVLLPAETSRSSSALERRTPTSSSLQGAASTAQMRDDQMRYEKCADESTEDFAERLRGCLMKRDIEVRQLRAQMAAAVAALQPQRMDIGAEVS